MDLSPTSSYTHKKKGAERMEPLCADTNNSVTDEDKENGGWNLDNIETGWSPDDPVMNAWLQSTIAQNPPEDDVFSPREILSNCQVDEMAHQHVNTPSSSSIVVYDRDNAIEALNMLGDTSILSQGEAKRIIKMLVKYVDHSDMQRKGMIEKEAILSTQLSQQERELASLRQGYTDEKRACSGLKKTIDRLMHQQEESRLEMNRLKMSLEFSKQKENAAVDACKKASQQVEEVKRKAAMKIDDAHKRLQELEVHMHLSGLQGEHGPLPSRLAADVEPLHSVQELDVHKPDVVSEVNMSEESKLLRSEMSMMQRKVDKSNALLNKTTKAAQKIQDKLIQERRKVAALQEERNQLQDQVLKLHQKPQGLDPKQVGKLIHDLATARSKVEYLDHEKDALSKKISLLQNEMSSISEDKRQALLKAESDASKALLEEQQKCEKLQTEMTELLQRLEEATKSLEDHDATRASLEDSQKRCAELAGALDQEQMASYQRSMEIERLANAAQACANELMGMREELHQEKMKVHRLENENIGLSGRLEAFSEALSAQEHSSEVIESLAEGRAMIQTRLKQAETERDALKKRNAEFEARVVETENYIQELESLLDTVHEDLSTSEGEKNALDASIKAITNELDHSKRINEDLNSVVDSLKKNLDASQGTVASLQKELDESKTMISRSCDEVKDLSEQLLSSTSRVDALCEEKNILTQDKGKLEVEVEHLKLSIERLDQQLGDSRNRCVSLEASLKAAEIQCDALRKSNAEAQHDSLSMVDSMSEMTNLIEAVNVLQSRVHELQAALATSQAKVSKLEDEKYALVKEVKIYEDHVMTSQEKMADMRSANEELRAEHRLTSNKLDTLSSQLEALRQQYEQKVIENSEKQSQIVELMALDATNAEEISTSRKKVKDLKRSLSESKTRIESLEQELVEFKDTNACLAEAKSSLEIALEETKGSLATCKGKLVVSSKRIERLEEAAKHIDILAKEFESLRSKHKKLLKQHLMDKEMFETLSRKYEDAIDINKDHVSKISEKDQYIQRLQSDIDDKAETINNLRISENCLKDEVARLSSLEPQIELLKDHINEGGSWCETAALTLQARAKELETSFMEANMARQDANALARQLAEAQEKVRVAETALQIREETLSEEQLAKDAALQTVDVLKEEIHVLSSQHKEMVGIIDAIKSAEEDATQKNREACEEIRILKGSVEEFKDRIHSADLEISKLNMSLQHLTKDYAGAISEKDTLKESNSKLHASLDVSREELHTKTQHLLRSEEISTQMKMQLEESSVLLAERDSQVESLQMEVAEYKSELSAQERSSNVLRDQCAMLESEIEFMKRTLLNNNSTSEQLSEVINFVEDERAQLRSDIANLNLLVDGMREEINQTRRESRELQLSKEEVEEKLFRTLDENKRLSENVASLEKDTAVLEVVRDQLEKESMADRDESTRAKLYCKEAEKEVSKIKNEYELFNQAMLGRLSAFEPILQRIIASLAGKLDSEVNNENENIINVPGISEQSDRIIHSLQKVEGYVGKLLTSLDSLSGAEQKCAEVSSSWKAERRAFKIIIRLSLAIASDNLSGTDDASDLYRKIETDTNLVRILRSSGLDHIWNSLSYLAQARSGLKTHMKMKNLSSQLADAKACLERTSRNLSEQQESSAKLSQLLQNSCQSMSDIVLSIEKVSGDVSKPTKFGNDMVPSENIEICLDSLRTSVNVMLRRYKSMVRSIGSSKARNIYRDLKDVAGNQLATKDEEAVRRNISTGSDKIPAVKI